MKQEHRKTNTSVRFHAVTQFTREKNVLFFLLFDVDPTSITTNSKAIRFQFYNDTTVHSKQQQQTIKLSLSVCAA